MHSLRIACIATLTSVPHLFAAPAVAHSRWWISAEAGYGQVRLTPEGAAGSTDGHFYLGLAGGLNVASAFDLGLHMSGWTFESSNLRDPRVGEGMMQVYATGRVYLGSMDRWQLRVAAGWVNHWNNDPDGAADAWGPGGEFGIAYLISPHARYKVRPALTVSAGEAGPVRFRAVTLSLGIGWP